MSDADRLAIEGLADTLTDEEWSVRQEWWRRGVWDFGFGEERERALLAHLRDVADGLVVAELSLLHGIAQGHQPCTSLSDEPSAELLAKRLALPRDGQDWMLTPKGRAVAALLTGGQR